MKLPKTFRVFFCGHQQHGASGLGISHIVTPFEKPVEIPCFKSDAKFVDASAGWGHSAFTTFSKDSNKFEVFAAGRSHDLVNTIKSFKRGSFFSVFTKICLAVGFGNSIDFPFATKIYESFDRPEVFTGAARTFIRNTSTGTVLTFGFNRFGQCGIDSQSHYAWKLDKPSFYSKDLGESSENVKEIAMGLQHSHFISDSGQMFSFGKGNCGQLGAIGVLDVAQVVSKNKYDHYFHPEPLHKKYFNDAGVVDVKCTNQSSLCLTDKNELFVFGKFQSVELNEKGDNFDHQYLPRKVPFDHKVKTIHSGSHYFLIETEDGNLHFMGTCSLNVDLSDLRLRIQALNPRYKFQIKDVNQWEENNGVNRIFNAPFLLPVDVEEGDKILPAFDGFYILRKNETNRLTYFDWNFEEQDVEIEIPEGQKIHSLKSGWKHSFFLTEDI